MNSTAIRKTAIQILDIEAAAIRNLREKIGPAFQKAVETIASCKGRIILTGMGKPGFIARKIAATMASTGTPSFYIHPAEAVHGDLGMVTAQDVVIAISQSGETAEIVHLLPVLKKFGVPLIAMTSRPQSTLAKHAVVILDLGVTKEACPLNLAPSASTTASLALGDALALCLSKKKKFKSEDFAVFHPGGSLGRRLMKIKDIMRTGKQNPLVKKGTSVEGAILKITSARAGSCTIVDSKGHLYGIFTDGDLRRHLKAGTRDLLKVAVENLGTVHPKFIHQDKLVQEAYHLLQTSKIDELPVVDDRGCVVGLLDVQDLLAAGV